MTYQPGRGSAEQAFPGEMKMTKENTVWTPSELQAPPETGELFWAWLHDTGIRPMIWRSDLYEGGGGYVLYERTREEWAMDDEYEPEFWAPYSAIPDPAEEWAHCHEQEPSA